jgi:hypothetical protein
MKNFTSFTFAVLAALTLAFSACVVEQPLDEVPTPPLNVLPKDPGDEGKETVQGVDADEDGLRDDVEIHISETYTDTEVRAATIQLALAFQALITTGTSKPSALTAATSMNRAIDCLYSLDATKFGDHVDDIEETVVNTGARARAYAKAGAFLSGGSYSVSTIADNSASCEEAP